MLTRQVSPELIWGRPDTVWKGKHSGQFSHHFEDSGGFRSMTKMTLDAIPVSGYLPLPDEKWLFMTPTSVRLRTSPWEGPVSRTPPSLAELGWQKRTQWFSDPLA